ncbi:MAG: PAS domain S-box protein [Halothiobacillaceae bacterium]
MTEPITRAAGRPPASFPRRFLFTALVMTLGWALSLGGFFLIERASLKDQLVNEASALAAGVDASLAIMEREMLHFATFIAGDPEVEQLMRAGRKAVQAEGGGAGGDRAAAIRARLYDHVAPRWLALQENHDARQLHFHLPDEYRSFLRVHEPERYGDRLGDVRHMVVEANRSRQPVTGFEIGRVYSGIRGLVPIQAEGADGPVHVGTLETGLGFAELLSQLAHRFDARMAVLLRAEHVEGVTWASHVRRHGLESMESCRCYVEAVTDEVTRDWLRRLPDPNGIAPGDYRLLELGGRWVSVVRVPLSAFSPDGASVGPVGSILLFSDRTATMHAFLDRMTGGVALAAGSFLVALFLAGLLLRRALHGLESEVVASREAQESSERFSSSLFDSAPDSVMILDADLSIVAVNRQFERQTGYPASEALGRHPDELFVGAHTDPAVLAELKQHVAEGKVWRGELRTCRKDGSLYWSLESVAPVLDDSGALDRVVVFQHDVSAQVAAQEALAERERLFRLMAENMTDMICLHDLEGRYTYVSPSVTALLGYAPGDLLGTDPFALFHPQDAERIRHESQSAVLAGQSSEITYRIRHRDGSWRWLESRATPVLDASGKVEGIQTASRDVSDRVRVEQELERSERLYRSIFEHVQEAIFLVGRDAQGAFRYRGSNPEHAQATGIPSVRLRDSRPADLLDPDTAAYVCAQYRQCWDSAEVLRYVEELTLPGGRRVWSTLLTPVRNAAGQVELLVGLSIDMTEERRLLGQLRENSRRLEHAQRLARVGSWEWDAVTNVVRWTDETYRIFDLPPHSVTPSPDLYLQHVHPDDLARVRAVMQQALDGEREYRFEYRLRSHLGRVKDVVVEGEVQRGRDGTLAGVMGTVQDITDRKQAERAVLEVSRENALILETAGEGIVGVDADGRVRFVNPAALTMLGLSPDAVVGRHILGLVRGEPAELPAEGWPRVLVDGRQRQGVQDRFVRSDGASFPVRLSVTPIGVERIEGAVCVFSDITELKAAETRLRMLASTDELTGLANRREFMNRAETEILRMRRGATALSVLMLDLDHFKDVNDRFGHAVGDAVLRRFATLCRSTFRRSDLPGRLGGEEFAVLLPDTSEAGAIRIAERFRQAVEETRWSDLGVSLSITVSIGGTGVVADEGNIEAALARADRALYGAKSAGRNRVDWLAADTSPPGS